MGRVALPTAAVDRRTIVLVVGLLATWVGVLLRLPLVSLVFLALVLGFLVDRRPRHAALLVLLSPLVFFAVLAAVHYGRGTARLLYVGLPGPGFHNLDPELRIPRATMGDLVSGDEWMAIVPNNVTLRLLTWAFGTMPRTYTAPCPDRAEAFAALEGARRVPVGRFVADVVVLDGREIRLDHGVGLGLLARLDGWDPLPTDDALSRAADPPADFIRAVLLHDRCLVVRIPEDPWGHRASFPPNTLEDVPARIALVDVERGRPFAYYAPKAGGGQRWPPVSWERP